MISNEIIKIASNTSYVGLKNHYTYKSSKKNSTCGDKITLELITDKKKIFSMKWQRRRWIIIIVMVLDLKIKIKF